MKYLIYVIIICSLLSCNTINNRYVYNYNLSSYGNGIYILKTSESDIKLLLKIIFKHEKIIQTEILNDNNGEKSIMVYIDENSKTLLKGIQ